MRKKIPFAGPSITQKEIDYVNDGVINGFYDNFSQHVEKLEKEIAVLGKEKLAMENQFANGEIPEDKIYDASQKLQKIINDIEYKEERWFEISMKMEES